MTQTTETTEMTDTTASGALPARPISVIGAGRMGAAIIGALCRQGWRVTAWNRDSAKLQALQASSVAASGLQVAGSLAAALQASPLVLVCITGYEAWRKLLAGLPAGALTGRTLVQLSTGSTDDAISLADLHRQFGAQALDGAIDSYPSAVLEGQGVVKVAGDAAAFETAAPALAALGQVSHLGPHIATAAALENASVFFTAAAFMAYFQGAAFFEHQGIPLQRWTETVVALMPGRADWVQAMEAAMLAHDHRGSDATLTTFQPAWQGLLDQARRAGMRTDFIEAISRLTQEAIARGWGEQEFSAHYELLRAPAAA